MPLWTFTAAQVREMLKSAARVDAGEFDRSQARASRPRLGVQPCLLRVTSGTADGNGFYPAVVTEYRPADLAYADYPDPVYLLPANGEALASGTRYGARPLGAYGGSLGFQVLQGVGAGDPIFGASGPSHRSGNVPDPGATAGASRFLREDATWAAAGGGGATATNQLQALTTAYTLTASFANVGLSVTLPNAGTYLLLAQVTASVNELGVTAGAYVAAQLRDTTVGVVVNRSLAAGTPVPVASGSAVAVSTFHISVLYAPVAAGRVIDLQAKYSAGATCSLDNGASYGYTTLLYVQLA